MTDNEKQLSIADRLAADPELREAVVEALSCAESFIFRAAQADYSLVPRYSQVLVALGIEEDEVSHAL